jgi:hypothetical protein
MMMGQQQGGMGGYYGNQMNGGGTGAAGMASNATAARYAAGGGVSSVQGGAQGGYGGNAYNMGSAYGGRAGGNLPDEDDDARVNRGFPSGQQAGFLKGGAAYGQGLPVSVANMQSRMYGAAGGMQQQMAPRTGYGGTAAYGMQGGNPAAVAASKLMAPGGSVNPAAMNGGMTMGNRSQMGMQPGGNPMMNPAGTMAPGYGAYRGSQGGTTQRTERGYPPY